MCVWMHVSMLLDYFLGGGDVWENAQEHAESNYTTCIKGKFVAHYCTAKI